MSNVAPFVAWAESDDDDGAEWTMTRAQAKALLRERPALAEVVATLNSIASQVDWIHDNLPTGGYD